jgi:hypothetical protein
VADFLTGVPAVVVPGRVSEIHPLNCSKSFVLSHSTVHCSVFSAHLRIRTHIRIS